MKTIAIIATTLAFACGCSNAATLQGKLDRANDKVADLQSRLEVSESRVQEVRADATKNADTCNAIMMKLDAARDYTSDKLHEAVPVVEQAAVDAYNAAKPKVSAAIDSGEDWVKGQYKKATK